MMRFRVVRMQRLLIGRAMSTYRFNQPKSVCVIGGGVAGLQTARAMQKLGVPHIQILVDQSRFGGVWSANKYETLGIQTPLKFYQFAEYLYAEHQTSTSTPYINMDLSEYAPADVLIDYIEGYASKFNLHPLATFDTKLESLSKAFDPVTGVHIGWDVTSRQTDNTTSVTDPTTERFEFVVVATGMYNEPQTVFDGIDNIEAFRKDGGITVHSSEFDVDNKCFKGKSNIKCAVIGAGKSGIDIAATMIANPDMFDTKSIAMIQRKAQWMVPRKIANLIPFEWLLYSKFAYYTFFPGFGHDAAHSRFFNSPIIKFLLLNVYWKVVEKVFAWQFGLRDNALPRSSLLRDLFKGGIIVDSTEINSMKQKHLDLRYEEEIVRYDEENKRFVLRSGDALPQSIDVLCSATGFKKQYDYFEAEDVQSLQFDDDGLYLYQQIVPVQLEKIAFIGSEANTYSNIATHFLQCEWLTHHMRQGTELDTTVMDANIAQNKQYKRSALPFMYCRASQIQVHLYGYHDLLCKDMHTDKHLKANLLTRWFVPYSSEDYARILPDTEHLTPSEVNSPVFVFEQKEHSRLEVIDGSSLRRPALTQVRLTKKL